MANMWADLADKLVPALRAVAAVKDEYSGVKAAQDGSEEMAVNLDAVSDDYKAKIKTAMEVLGEAVTAMDTNDPNSVEAAHKTDAVRLGLTSLLGLRILDTVHPDMWDYREEIAGAELEARGYYDDKEV